jgi:2-oxoisovalerate dehydrogenase E1 component alpha subunit
VAPAPLNKGPTLIENRTYRMGMHNTTDNPAAYRDSAEVSAAAAADPIARVQRYLAARGRWDAETEQSWSFELAEEVRAAIDRARSYPAATPADVFDHVYANPPSRVLDQRRTLLDS